MGTNITGLDSQKFSSASVTVPIVSKSFRGTESEPQTGNIGRKSESLIAIFSNMPLLNIYIWNYLAKLTFCLYNTHTLDKVKSSVYWYKWGHLWTFRDLNLGMATRGLCHWPNKHMCIIYFQSALLFCGSDSTSVSPADVLQDGLNTELKFPPVFSIHIVLSSYLPMVHFPLTQYYWNSTGSCGLGERV